MTRDSRGASLVQWLAALPLELIRASLLVAAFGSATLALCALLGRFSALLDVVSHFALPAFLGTLVVLVLALLVNRREHRSAASLAALGLACWGLLIGPDFAARLLSRNAPAGGEMVRIVQLNVWAFNYDKHGTSDWILAQNADVIVLEEVAAPSMSVVRKLSDRYPFVQTCAQPSPCSTVILSRTQPLRAGGQLFTGSQSALTWMTLPAAGGDFTITGVHQSWPFPLSDQAPQTKITAETLRMFDPASLIVAGDFNSTPWSAALSRQDKLFGLSRRTRALSTFPARVLDRRGFDFPTPFLPIDHIYAGKAWKTVSIIRGPRLGSDHYPVVATFRRGP